MILWILALVLLGTLGVVGYYQGAVRVAFSLVGLLLAAALAMPLAFLAKPFLSMFGVNHPLLLAFIAPAIMYLVILITFKVAGFSVHKKLDTYYKYKASDTAKSMYERLNQHLGVCLGLANATVYFVLICVVAYLLGYVTIQVSSPETNSFSVRVANLFAEALQSTKMATAVAGFVPAKPNYYDAVDIIGDVYQNPLLQSRLASYPAFLSLAEQPNFQALAKDREFQENIWLKQPRPSFKSLFDDSRINPIVQDVTLFTNALDLVNYDLQDLKTYVETGKSPKYQDEVLLGYWYYDFGASYKRARRAKLSMSPIELKRVRQDLGAMTNATLMVTLDKQLFLKVPPRDTTPESVLKGTWTKVAGDSYKFSLEEEGHALNVPTVLESGKLVLRKENRQLVFAR